ncbi:tellurite resistance TerB family protein [Hymenobacter defluvii]|uniref:Tellurite resistance TerB family protein n=1 Tax=Hymenobacter defluvii TaxID=2054411 RepID=A0ABS3THP3_9BACT|nr:tellurite resistance TerB family protein [Hymenobacter defluvii]MBO3273192.1 tellurite resistance TerB family protein [Hymenobacter defluvii]
MGLFDKVFSSNAAQTNPFTDSRDAFFAILYACMSADGNVDDEEINALVAVSQQKAFFRGYDIVSIYRRIAPKVIALGNVLEAVTQAAPQIPVELRETLFATCVDFAAADGMVGRAEQSVLEHLQQALELDSQRCLTIIDVILVKNKG